MSSKSLAVRRAAALAALLATLAVGAPSALGAEEATTEGPLACSAVSTRQSPARPWRIDLWVQCNYEVSEISAMSRNRKLRWVGTTPELFGAGSSDGMTCRMTEGIPTCRGQMKPFARIHIRLNVNDAACNRPVMRMTVDAFGGASCKPGLDCVEIGSETLTPTAVGRPHTLCASG